jgi:hypothetical protein
VLWWLDKLPAALLLLQILSEGGDRLIDGNAKPGFVVLPLKVFEHPVKCFDDGVIREVLHRMGIKVS